MIPLENNNIEEIAVLYFLEKEGTAKSLRSHLGNTDKGVTIQGVYKALKKLTANGILIKKNKNFVVSREWAENLIQILGGKEKYIDLKQGESASFTFNSLTHLDAYWKHVLIALDEFGDFPAFFYNPHEIWTFLEDRQESQEKFLKSFNQEKRYGYLRLGDTSPIEKEYKKNFGGEFLQIDLSNKKIFNDYVTVVQDYIVTTKISRKSMEKIDELFSQDISFESIKIRLRGIISEKQKVKLVIENNKDKAKKIRKRISENFYIPKELIKKYDLF